MKNLFLTGPIGCGKSTCIARALGQDLARAGGFLTVRQRGADGRAAAFRLIPPAGGEGAVFLDGSSGSFVMHPEIFDRLGVSLLEQAGQYDFVVLDEIGGFELLSDGFWAALLALLRSPVPCIGVMKGEGPAGKMIRKLGLEQVYAQRAAKLRQWMEADDQTLLYECTPFDPEALRLARCWSEQYVLRNSPNSNTEKENTL